MATTLTTFVVAETMLTTSAATIAQPAANVKAYLGPFSFTNNHTARVTVTIYRLASGGTASATNILLAKSVAVGECWTPRELIGKVLDNQEKLQAKASVTSVVVVNGGGVEES